MIMEGLQIFNGDCLEVMKTLPDKSIDLFVCDLPYGQLDTKGKDRGEDCAWDVKIDLEKFWEQVKRLCKNDHTPVLMFCNTKFGIELINSNPSWFRYDLVWDKGHGISFLLANKMPMKSHEMIYVFSKKGAYYNRIDEDRGMKAYGVVKKEGDYTKQYGVERIDTYGNPDGKRCSLSVIKFFKQARDGHPTEKCVELYNWLIERYSNEGDTVMDATAGSFNSCVSAIKLKRKAIGIEKDKTFFDKFNNNKEKILG